MEKLRWLASGIVLIGMLLVPFMAVGVAGQGGPQEVAAGETEVSQIQQDIVNKQERTRQRNKELLKLRAKTIKAEEKMTEEEKARLHVGATAK